MRSDRRVDPARGEEVAHGISEAGGQAVFVRADMSQPGEVEALVKKAVESYGRLDCAFNNAATEGTLKMTADFTEGEFDDIIKVNLRGVWLCMKHQIRQMLGQHPAGGAIINTSSINGRGGMRRHT